MLPVIAIVGRPNVGKSTLFNCLTKSRDALVADQPGLTRDRNYGIGKVGDRPYIVVDTGGLSGDSNDLDSMMADQAYHAIEEADVVLFLVDAHAGVTAGDEVITPQLRQMGKPVFLILNKIDGLDESVAQSEFYTLGLGEPLPIAAAHRKGISQLMDHVLAELPEAEEALPEQEEGIRIAVVGRPNVGKSTLINRMLGEERVLVFDMAGTTRDSIKIPYERDGEKYTLIDTAGVRRRGRISEVVEKFSVIKTLQAIEGSNVVIQVLDAGEGVTDQDASLLGFVIDSGRALVIAVNKWDGLSPDHREKVKDDLERKLYFVNFAKMHFISALHGTGVGNLYKSVHKAYDSAKKDLSTPFLTQILEQATLGHQPPLVKGRRIKLRYAHQGGQNPPVIVIHGNQASFVPESYKRYLVNVYRKALKLEGTPIRVEFRTSENPFKGKRNVLTKRQQDKRKRLMKHVKKKGK